MTAVRGSVAKALAHHGSQKESRVPEVDTQYGSDLMWEVLTTGPRPAIDVEIDGQVRDIEFRRAEDLRLLVDKHAPASRVVENEVPEPEVSVVTAAGVVCGNCTLEACDGLARQTAAKVGSHCVAHQLEIHIRMGFGLT